MPAGIVWQAPPEQAWTALANAYARSIHAGVEAIANRYKPEIENWMKANAPWTDRTGNARQGLYADVDSVAGRMVTLILAHGVEYGLWLEIRHAGAYAVVNPAIDHFAPRIWADIVRMLQ